MPLTLFLVLWVVAALFLVMTLLTRPDPSTRQRMAVAGAVLGLGILGFGSYVIPGSPVFLTLWVLAGLAIIASNLWTAFRR